MKKGAGYPVAVAIAATLLFLSPALLLAQAAASMTGVVTDASGALIPGTTILLTNKLTGLSYQQTTDATGTYRFANVSPNDGYTAVFSHNGFASLQVDKIALNVGNTRTQNARLVAGQIEKVEVSAATSNVTLDTTDASIGNNIDVTLLNALPIQDRTSPSALFSAQPGVDNPNNGGSGSVTGARTDQTEVTLDGLDVNDIAAGSGLGQTIVGFAPVDSVQEFRGTVAGMVPSIGTGSGGQFQLVTKSGTNQFHGNLSEYHRDTTTVANSWFNNLDGLPRTPLIRNQFGGSLGGPIRKNKLYFFADVLQSRIIQSSTVEQGVPTPSFKAGNLSYISGGTDSATGQTCADSSRLNTNPECIETLNSAQVAALDPAGFGFNQGLLAFINKRYPDPNVPADGDGVNSEGFRFTTPTPDIISNYIGRVDYNLTPTQKIYARANIGREDATSNTIVLPHDPATQPYIDRSYGYVVSHVWTIGQNKVNQLYYGDSISKIGNPFSYNPTGANQYSFSGFSSPYLATSGQKRRFPVPMLRDDFNWQIGNHSLAFGGTFKFIKTTNYLQYNFNFVGVGQQGSVFYNGLDAPLRPPDIGSGNAAIDDYDSTFLTALGVIGDISSNFNYDAAGTPLQQGSGSTRHYRYYQTEVYAGDTWKATPKLTLNYGVRYQLYTVPYETSGEEAVPNFTGYSVKQSTLSKYMALRVAQSNAGISGPSSVPFITYNLGGKANHGPNLYSPSYKDFAPRVAFSYNPTSKTVFNGGAGIVYDRTVISAVDFIQDQASYLFEGNTTNQFGSPATDTLSTVDNSILHAPRLTNGLNLPPGITPLAPPITKPLTPYVDSTGEPFGLAQGGSYNYAVDPSLKDPYSITINAGVQQEFPGHTVLKLNYVGRLGRRLLAQVDASQIIDFPDPKSDQTLAGAFGGLTLQERAGVSPTNLAAEPWFEDVIAAGLGTQFGFPNNTSLVGAIAGVLGARGDFASTIESLSTYNYYYFPGSGILPDNVGMASQLASNDYMTNKGSSSYNGLLLTVDKNMAKGLQADFNYTWSHSIDNTSLVANSYAANGYGFICDVLRPRSCRGNSDFDAQNEISSDFVYALPAGHGRQFLASSPLWLEEFAGGWDISGLLAARSGRPIQVFSEAFLAGYANNAAAIFTGRNKADLKPKVNVDHTTNTVYQFAGGAAGAAKALNDFTGPVGLHYGHRNDFRAPGAFSLDMGLAKTLPLIPSRHLDLKFRADAYNILNHPIFDRAHLDIVTSVSPFGQVGATTGEGARVAQFSLRLEF